MTEPRIVVVGSKSVLLALVLTFFFGPFGMLYSTVAGGLIMLVLACLVGFFTAGFGLFFIWPVQMLWAGIAASNYNKGQVARVQRQLR